jgi:hypothetical protein
VGAHACTFWGLSSQADPRPQWLSAPVFHSWFLVQWLAHVWLCTSSRPLHGSNSLYLLGLSECLQRPLFHVWALESLTPPVLGQNRDGSPDFSQRCTWRNIDGSTLNDRPKGIDCKLISKPAASYWAFLAPTAFSSPSPWGNHSFFLSGGHLLRPTDLAKYARGLGDTQEVEKVSS